jgi:hypothetical protein
VNGEAGAALAVRLVVAAIPVWKQHGLTEECRAAVTLALDDRFKVHRSATDDEILRTTLGVTRPQSRHPLPHGLRSIGRATE